MALDIRFNGIKPQQKCYHFSIQNNAENDKVFFILQSDISNIVSLKDLSKYDVYLKCESAGKEYLDKIKVDCFYVENLNTLTVPFVLPLKTTQYRNVGFQLQFQDANSNLIAQTEIVGMELCGTIKADEEISDKYPSELVRIENDLTQQAEELANHESRIETLEQNVPYTEKEIIVSDDVDSFENENGVDKLIRELESDGSVEKTFLIDKIYHEATLIECHAVEEYNNVHLSSEEMIIDALGGDDFYNVLGANTIIEEQHGLFTLYYNVDEEIKGITFKNYEDDYYYGSLQLSSCTPNEIVKVVVGKYFEYDEHGNKVFDENKCCIYSNCFLNGDEEGEYREITQEKQEFSLKTKNDGSLYFDSDNEEDTGRFILYSISIGEPAYTEYKKREIGKGGGGGVSNDVEIKRVWLSYADKMLMNGNYLGTNYIDKEQQLKLFLNDSTRIFYNFETTPISSQIEDEIANGRFVIRLDYPNHHRVGIENMVGITKKIIQRRTGIGARAYTHTFNGVGNAKKELLLKSLIFIEPSDIKTNRYGEKYIHKQVSLFDYINNICQFYSSTLSPITNEWVNNDNLGKDFFHNHIEDIFSCGIPTTQQNGGDVFSDGSLFAGIKQAQFYRPVRGNVSIEGEIQGRANSMKLNPAFSCFTLVNLKSNGGLYIYSPYFIGKTSHEYEQPNDNYVLYSRTQGTIGKKKSRKAYMSARPRCAILADDYETADYAFLKTMPQSDQQIKLSCKIIKEIFEEGIEYMPIFRTFITQK